MICKQTYQSPLGLISLIADDRTLLGAWFLGQKYCEKGFEEIDLVLKANSVLEQAKVWLDTYFAGQNLPVADFLAPQGTAFQKQVWQILTTIPAGSTMTYGQIAKKLNCRSARAVGSAVGKNPISIFIPCHRVLGSQGKLTGYAGGLAKKTWLLEHEGLTITSKK